MTDFSNIQRMMIERDGLTIEEAREQFAEMCQCAMNGDDPRDMMEDNGLDADWFIELFTCPFVPVAGVNGVDVHSGGD